MKVFVMLVMLLMMCSSAHAYQITAPEGKTLKIHWAVLQSKPGKMPDMAAISSRTVARVILS